MTAPYHAFTSARYIRCSLCASVFTALSLYQSGCAHPTCPACGARTPVRVEVSYLFVSPPVAGAVGPPVEHPE